LTPDHFAEFERCYGDNPSGEANRSDTDSAEGRWRMFTIDEVRANHYKLDAFRWTRDEEVDKVEGKLDPEELITEAMEELQLALDNLSDIQRLLEVNGEGG
jgi:type I restriction enzyme M protein